MDFLACGEEPPLWDRQSGDVRGTAEALGQVWQLLGSCSAQVLHALAAAFLTQKHYQEISKAPSALLGIAKTLKRKIHITEWSKI